MIRVTYKTVSEDSSKPEETLIRIFDGKYFASYNVTGKAEATVKKMRQDGRKGVLYTRGVMLQTFIGKSEDEILEIVKKDIDNGLEEAMKQTKKKLHIENLVIKKQ